VKYLKIGGVVLVTILIYVLSARPVWRWFYTHRSSREAEATIRKVYPPLVWLSERSKMFEKAIHAYVIYPGLPPPRGYTPPQVEEGSDY
jgi:hypothetical protein